MARKIDRLTLTRKEEIIMDRKYIYEMPNGKLTIVTSRNLDWEMSDDHILRTDLEIADHYRGQDNHVAYVDGHDIYHKHND